MNADIILSMVWAQQEPQSKEVPNLIQHEIPSSEGGPIVMRPFPDDLRGLRGQIVWADKCQKTFVGQTTG